MSDETEMRSRIAEEIQTKRCPKCRYTFATWARWCAQCAAELETIKGDTCDTR